MKNQVCTFPYALHSTPTFNKQAYPFKIDNGCNKPCRWIVWSPIHYPHYVGKFAKQEGAQQRADQINAQKSEWIYAETLPQEQKDSIYNHFDA